MRATVSCHTCRYSDWGYKFQPHEISPCGECIGFHKWAKRHPDNNKDPRMIDVECPHCSNTDQAPKKCAYTGYAYNKGWVTRCTVCGGNMKEVKSE